MPSISANTFKAVAIAAFLVAVLAGIWRGIASCGGYIWQGQAVLVVLTAAAFSVIVFTPSHAPSLPRRALLSVAIIATFFVVRALSAPFYPALPGFGEYFYQVGMALYAGPC